MKATRPAVVPSKAPVKRAAQAPLFGKENYTLMLVGVAILILGFILMAGGGSDNPAEFNPAEVYSPRRITVAPIVILLGLAVEIYAIFRQPKNTGAAE